MTVELAVVGAGPAGLGAAAAATSHGVRTMLLDRRAQAGGQYYARPLRSSWLAGLPHGIAGGVRRDLLDARMQTDVWGAFPERTLALAGVDGSPSSLVAAESIVFATGASERPQPFPGWELPGVVSAGGMQLLLKESRIVPSGSVVVAGTGPFLLAVASQLASAGATVRHLVEARGFRELSHLAPALLREPALWTETAGMVWPLRSVDRRFGATIRRVFSGGLELSTGDRLQFDTLCVGHGFTPRVELLAQLGCAISPGGAVVSADLETSQAGVFAAGEATGIGGARLAHAEGRLAGLVVADRLRRGSVTRRELGQARAACERLQDFARRLFRVYRALDPLALATPDTTICRCEGVSLREIMSAGVHPTVDGVRALKARLRCGMGACQGTMCLEPIRAALGYPGEHGWLSPSSRPPVGDISVAAVAALKSLS